jgi:hypothetical protein
MNPPAYRLRELSRRFVQLPNIQKPALSGGTYIPLDRLADAEGAFKQAKAEYPKLR